jgi:hypothetical protein
MVHSSALTVSTNGECLTCSGFSLGETICFGSLEFITDCFGSLNLSPKRNDLGVTFMGSPRSGTPIPLWAMIEDSTEEFFIAPSGEGGSSLPSSRRHNTGAPSSPIATTPWLEDAPATQAMTTAEHRPLLRVMARFLGAAMSMSPCSES